MKTFLKKAACFTAIQIVIATVVLGTAFNHDSDEYLAAINDKYKLLRTQPGKRIIFIGGSSAAFGVNGEIFKDELDMNPVNLGLNHSIGLEFNLQLVEKYARDGDIIVIMPEYRHLTVPGRYEGDLKIKTKIMAQWPGAFRFFDDPDKNRTKLFLDNYGLPILAEQSRRTRRIASESLFGEDDGDDGIYKRSSFNEYGDIVAHYGKRNPEALKKLKPLQGYDSAAVERSVEGINAFARRAEKKGALVTFAYQPLPTDLLDQSKSVVEPLHEQLTKTLAIPILAPPSDWSYSLDYFYDSRNHLNEQGVDRRSQFLIEKLKTIQQRPTTH